MILFLLACLLPAVLLVALGSARHRKLEQPGGLTDWIGFLSIGLALLLGILLFLTSLHEGSSLPVLILLPAICAFFGELLLSAFKTAGDLMIHRRTLPGWHWAAGFLLLVLVMFLALGRWGDRSILLTIVVGGLLLACGWLVWHTPGRWFGLSYIIVLLLMLAAVWATDTHNDFAIVQGRFASAGQILFWLAPGLGMILSCRLLGRAIKSEPESRSHRFLLVLMVIPILILLGWQTVTASAWDVATDGLGGIAMLMLVAVFGVAAGMHESWDLSSRKYPISFGFVLLFLIVTAGASSFGTYGLQGKWGAVPHERTERRAVLIDKAIQRYYQVQGRYPQSLSLLTPGYLLYLPNPFIIPHQGWCYEGGLDYYRLGYVDRDFFSTPAFVRMFASAGPLPDAPWVCEAEAAKYPAPMGYSTP